MNNIPFKNTHNNNLYNKLKIILFTLTGIGPIRFILVILLSILISLSISLFLIGFKTKDNLDNYNNISLPRRVLLIIPQFLGTCLLGILGYWINEDFNENKFFKYTYLERKNAPKLIIANHVSFIDSLYFLTRGFPSIVAGANTINLPIFGFALDKMNPILVPVNENQKLILPNPKVQITNRLTHPSVENLKRPLLIFPEGTTKNSKFLLKFQSGAFHNKIKYQPILLDYKYKYLDPSWTLDTNTYQLLYLMCCQFINYLDVKYLEQTDINEAEIRKIFITKLNLIDSNLSNHDNHFMRKNIDKFDYIYHHIYYEGTFNIEYYKKRYNLNYEEISELMKEFYKLDVNKIGIITEQDINILIRKMNVSNITVFKKSVTFNDLLSILYE